ncbi:phosphate acyltransferase PlsX [Parashewanella spongiae]|uniref:Phosphate acyltransferase n=1 Tax=Parashewanella spongiae TaxID=342950 RepID=A0A3A6UHX6_9GAMM|nr:phosphate acyltransferase PlsX [Parashewanella spongiae]MCL1077489.1 phosphate acyltransferase PlsX [Parashewanella spongiae]RJY18654.1 phosphate acyltransferase PlsX [Parashewanella spongiae]
MTNLTLALDAMGGDNGPQVSVPASLQALRFNPNLKIILVGDQTKISPYLTDTKDIQSRFTVIHTDEVVTMTDRPAQALRNRKNSSMRKVIELVRDGGADACLSAGNTGALMAISKVLLKTLPGIDRPALIGRLPTSSNKPVYVLDLGANVSCDSETLFQFAVMGSVVCEVVEQNKSPTVSLLNVGIEEIKGNDQVQQAGLLLQESPQINYSGFIEGHEIYSGSSDVIVCDGFVGNITLKTSEGIAKFLIARLKKGFTKGIIVRFLSKLVTPHIESVFNQMNPDHYNGASLVGLRGVVVKSHGNADKVAFTNAINLAVTEAQRRLPELISERLKSIL